MKLPISQGEETIADAQSRRRAPEQDNEESAYQIGDYLAIADGDVHSKRNCGSGRSVALKTVEKIRTFIPKACSIPDGTVPEKRGRFTKNISKPC